MAKDHFDKERPYLVVIDPGHGGQDPGAVNEEANLNEKDVNLNLALSIKEVVESVGYCYRVALTRNEDKFLSLQDRCLMANDAHAAAFVSIHSNSAEDKNAQGYEVWTSRGQTKADRLATEIFVGLGAFMKTSKGRPDYDDDDPDRETNFHVLRNTIMPAVLIEVEFISNDAKAQYLKNKKNLWRIAFGIADSIEFYLEG